MDSVCTAKANPSIDRIEIPAERACDKENVTLEASAARQMRTFHFQRKDANEMKTCFCDQRKVFLA